MGSSVRIGSRSAAAVAAGLALAVSALAATPASAHHVEPGNGNGDVLAFAPTQGDDLVWAGSQSGGSLGPVPTASQAFAGDFTAEPGTDVFLYRPGPGADGIVTGLADPTAEIDVIAKTVGGTYTPLVGDFDGNAIDDILWYGPGSAPDSLWRFTGSGSHTVVPLTISGRYRPLVFEANGDGYDDVIWYAPGTAADTIWLFGAGAARTGKPVTIDGDYTLVPGVFGLRPEGSPQERLLFWKNGGRDAIWTFDTSANHTSRSLAVTDGRPIVGDFHGTGIDSVLAYLPGSGSESMLTFDADGIESLSPGPQVSGTYAPVVLDHDNDEHQDIAWTGGPSMTIWSFGTAPEGSAYAKSNLYASDSPYIAVPAYRDPADL